MALDVSTTPEEFTQWMTRGFTAVAPADVPAVSVTNLLTRHRKTLQSFRAKGYSLAQICSLLEAPPFSVKISKMGLSRLIGSPRAAKKAVKYTIKVPLNVVPLRDRCERSRAAS